MKKEPMSISTERHSVSPEKAIFHRFFRNIRAAAFLFSSCVLTATSVWAATDVEFVLDLSGSMRQKLGADSKIESARKSLLSALDEIPKGQLVAVRVYGHRIEQQNKTESCKDTELLVPFKEVDKNEISQKISSLTPKGYTPIAYTLNETRNDLYDVGVSREAERVIILLTDGEETCGGDPVAVLKKLKGEGFNVTVYTIGVDVDEVARKQLQAIAAVSGGKYFDAKDSTQLTHALTSAAQASAVVEKKEKSYGNAVRGADNYEEATPIQYGIEYRLDHHQKKNDLDYFSFNAVKGNRVTLRLNTQAKGIHGVGTGDVQETVNPYAGAEIHDEKRNNLAKLEIVGEAFKTKDISYRPAETGKEYLVIGSAYEDMHKDYSTFTLTEEKLGDADSDKDAGETTEDAMPIEAKRYNVSYIGDSDKTDVYSFVGKKDDKVMFGIIPAGQSKGYFTMRVLDEFKQVLLSDSSASGAGLKSKEITLPDDGTYYFEVNYPSEETAKYSFLVKKTAANTGVSEEKGNPDQ